MGNFDDVERYETALRLEVLDEMAKQGADQWRRMSDSELARRSGLSTSEIGRLLDVNEPRGRLKRPPWTAAKILGIATALGLTPSELTTRAEGRYLEGDWPTSPASA